MLSINSARGGNGKANAAPIPPPTPPVNEYAPRPKPSEPHRLGVATIQAVDQITEISASEVEKLAEQVEAAAHETAEGLRECARRMRVCGVNANERLANFVRVATTCNDAARMMLASVEHRDDPGQRDDPPRPAVEQIGPPRPPDLAALAAEIRETIAPR